MNVPDEFADIVKVHNRRALGVEELAAQRVGVGAPGDYKPCVAKLPGGELLLVAFRMCSVDGTRRLWGRDVPLVREDILLFRSQDAGITWSGPELPPIVGREPYLTVLSDGTILVTVHLLTQDVRNEAGYTQTYVHRSTDGGGSWDSTLFSGEDLPGWQPGWSTCSSRNVLELSDDTLILGVGTAEGINFLYRSTDKGRSWRRAEENTFELFEGPEGRRKLRYPVWGETVFWQAPNGDLLALNRMEPKHLPALGDQQMPNGHWDHHDRLVLYRSRDGGRFWSYGELGSYYGEMYPAILRLGGGRLLLTFTVRDLRPPLGVRAVLGGEMPDGFEFDFEHDRIMLDTKTPVDKDSGGGFGRTVQADDGTLVTSYSYRDAADVTHCEVVRWRLP